jgi:hypothetical protein
MRVERIQAKDTYDFILNVHYAKRIPSISFAFGLFDGTELIGVVTYGRPFSSTLRVGVCGKESAEYVWELNRLVLKYNRKNEASFLVSNSMRMMPKPSVIVSYADKSQGHVGFVYQACNFIYCGLSAKRSEYVVEGMEHLHSQTISDMSKGKESRIGYLKERFGNRLKLKERPRKHRYVYFIGSHKEVKIFKSKLKYPIEKYPKDFS